MVDSSSSLFPMDENGTARFLKECFHCWLAQRVPHSVGPRAGRELNEASTKVYQEMWYAFADYCSVHGLSLQAMTEKEIEQFLHMRARGEGRARMLPKGETLSPRYAWRMLTLIDRITSFAAEREGVRPNRAARELLTRPEYRYANARQKDPLPEYYTDAQVAQVIGHLNTAAGLDAAASPSWKTVRDCAAIALMLGGGLAPGDVRGATTSGIYVDRQTSLPWKISLPGNGNAPARETPIAPWAATLLQKWTTTRNEQGIPGDVLFASTLSGKPMSHATCYKVCRAVLEDAGMEDDEGGVFKLRHTFALRQLADGKSEVDVARWLGLVDLNGMARYRNIVKAPVEVV
jgi:site-specific recombinase XerD